MAGVCHYGSAPAGQCAGAFRLPGRYSRNEPQAKWHTGRVTEHTNPTTDAEPNRRELDLEDITAGGYFTIGRHTFMVQRMNLDVTARAPHRNDGEPERELEEIDMRLVHARWKCCNA